MKTFYKNLYFNLIFCASLLSFGSIPFSSATLFGELQRFQVSDSSLWPNNTVGLINDFCTGTLIAPNKVLTAAHCLYDFENKSLMPVTKFNMARNGIMQPGVILDVKRITPHPFYVLTGDKNYDVGIITLVNSVNIDYRNLLSFKFDLAGWNLNPSTLSYDRIGTIIGYPGDKLVGTMWYVACNFERRVSEFNIPHYNCDTFGGMSGSPIIISENGMQYITGVHTNGGNINAGLFIYGEIQTFINEELAN